MGRSVRKGERAHKSDYREARRAKNQRRELDVYGLGNLAKRLGRS